MTDKNELRSNSVDRRALIAVATQFFVNGVLPASFIPRLPEIRDQVGITVAGVGLLVSLAGLAGLAGSAAVGPAVERFGTRRVMVTSAVVISVALGVIGLATTPALLLVGLIGIMAFDVLVDVPMNMQASWLSARRHTPVMNRLHGLWSLGTVVGGGSAAWIAAAGISLRSHLIAAGATMLVVLMFVSRGLLRTDESHATNDESPKDDSQPQRRFTPMPTLFILAGFFAVALEYTSSDWAAFRLVDDLGAAAGFAGLGYIAATGGMTVGRLAGDWVEVRIGVSRLVQLAIALSGIGLTLAALTPSRQVTLVGYLIAGLGISTMLPRLYDDAAKLPGRPGTGLGALTAGIRIATLAVPVGVGALAATSLSVGSAIAITTLPCVAGFFAVTRALRRT